MVIFFQAMYFAKSHAVDVVPARVVTLYGCD